jgi:hypothetical protein
MHARYMYTRAYNHRVQLRVVLEIPNVVGEFPLKPNPSRPSGSPSIVSHKRYTFDKAWVCGAGMIITQSSGRAIMVAFTFELEIIKRLVGSHRNISTYLPHTARSRKYQSTAVGYQNN